MRSSILLPSLALSCSTVLAASDTSNSTATPGYNGYPTYLASTVPSNTTLDFGSNYAILNLDLINGIVGSVANSTQGQTFIANTAHWINTVHAQVRSPLTIFTRIYYVNARKPELGTAASPVPFPGSALGNSSDPNTEIYPAFHVDEANDVVLSKTRYYAGTSNELEEILSSQKIDTVVLSGVRTSGVILSTVYRLFDLNYKVYVIVNNTIETAPDPGSAINTAILEGVIPKLPANVITIEQAIAGLENSGTPTY